MPQQVSQSVQNNFLGGLKTEFTGLNFPENACTDTQNCVFTLIGDVLRREGIDFEVNYLQTNINRAGQAISTYKWNNVGGDGQTQIVVVQVGTTLYFFQSTNATVASPLSTTKLAANVNITAYLPSGSSATPGTTECQYTDGNGYLFVFHPNLDPFYCYYAAGSPPTVIPNPINIQIRDFAGIYPEPGNPAVTTRPTTLNNEHRYNLQNQGWTDTILWSTNSGNYNLTANPTTILAALLGTQTFTVAANLNIHVNDPVNGNWSCLYNWLNNGVVYGPAQAGGNVSGVVTAYSGTTLTVNWTTQGQVTNISGTGTFANIGTPSWTLAEANSANALGTWFSALGNYPSNTDVWWTFKNSSGVYSPSTTVSNINLSTTPAPRGHFILSAFTQTRSASSGVANLTNVSTFTRPRTGTWFQGRVWYTGVDASQNQSGDQPFYTWTENLYFSQIITDTTQFGYCYQTNDPTSQNLFDLLPSDGGVITIQGSGAIYKLFPVQNGMLVFAANGIWFITGSQGIGFSANDYTITKISGIQSLSSTSYVNVMGYPMFWNEEGIYAVAPGNTGSLTVNNICLGTILTFYSNIPLQSKKFARGDYHNVDFIVQWMYRSTNESNVTDRYQYDRILCLNVVTKAFYVYALPAGTPYIHGITYVQGPGGSTSPAPTFKYLTSALISGNYQFTFSEERDVTHYKDWFTIDSTGQNYISYFITGYQLKGHALTKWQPSYIYMYLRNSVQNSYKIQGLWEFAISGNSGKWSTVQVINDVTSTAKFGMLYRRHKVRGRGMALQIKVASVDGKPFDIMGWSTWENINASV